MNALQRAQRRNLILAATEARDTINAQPVPPFCVACGERLDDQAMAYCFDSDNGFHVKPSSN